MRQDMHHLSAIRTLDVTGDRRLFSRGNPRNWDLLPTHQSMRASVPHYTYPRVVKMTAAKRWLEKQAGRPWNAVYAELRARFDPRNSAQNTVLQRLVDQVEIDVYFDGDQPRVQGTYGSWAVSGLYVHPETGMLLRARPEEGQGQSTQRAQQRERAKAEVRQRRIDKSSTLQMHLLNGQWYWVELAPITAPAVVQVPPLVSRLTGEVLVAGYSRIEHASVCKDVVTGQSYYKVPVHYWETVDASKLYGRAGVYAKRKWQASARDIARMQAAQ